MKSGGYQIIDEGVTRPDTPPWNPVSLFFLTGLVGAVGAVPFVFNWGRLGQPERRWRTVGLAVLAGVAPIAAAVLFSAMGHPLDRSTGRFLVRLASIVLAYYLLQQQQPLFQNHLLRGGRKGNTLFIWCIYLFIIGFSIWLIPPPQTSSRRLSPTASQQGSPQNSAGEKTATPSGGTQGVNTDVRR
jgi:hypothetical protein